MNSDNVAVFTLSELTTIKDCVYLFEFKNTMTNEYIYFTSADISSFKNRYNKFTIRLVDDIENINLLNGTIKLLQNRHVYQIYQTSILISDEFDIDILKDKKLDIIETGLVNVIKNESIDLIYNINRNADILYVR